MSLSAKIKEFFRKIAAFCDNLRDRSVFWRFLLNKYTLIILFFLIWVSFIDINNMVQLVKTEVTLKEQEQQILYYKNAIKKTDDKIQQLTSNKDSLEMFAREQYYFLEDGEDVFLVDDMISK